MHQYYDIPERKWIFLNFPNWGLEILVPEHKMMGDISIVTKKYAGLAKYTPQRNFLYELSKKNPPAELGPTSPEVGVDSRFGWGFIYRVPEKKDSKKELRNRSQKLNIWKKAGNMWIGFKEREHFYKSANVIGALSFS